VTLSTAKSQFVTLLPRGSISLSLYEQKEIAASDDRKKKAGWTAAEKS
jgi:hypothetical protein